MVFSRIVVGFDGRAGGLDAVALARRLAAPGSTLALVTVVSSDDDVPEAEHILAGLPASDGQTTETVVAGSVTRGLRDAAARHDADLLVLGSCHHGLVSRVLLGNDALRTLRAAPCPVALAPVGYRDADHPIAAIGVAWDGSPEAEGALVLGRTLCADIGAALHAMQVIPIGEWISVPNAYSGPEFDEAARRAQERLDGLTGVTGEARVGSVVQELSTFATTVDLLALGTHPHGAFGRLVLGSTAEEMVRCCPRPLLVVPGAQ